MSAYVVQIEIGGSTYSLPYESHQWTLQGGYEPVIEEWAVPAEIAEDIMSSLEGASGTDREATLHLGGPGDPVTVERVIVLKTIPHPDPQKRYLVLADVRWYLLSSWFCADVNVRRRLGDKRVIGATLEDAVVADEIGYAPWSIDGSTAHTWDSHRDDVLAYLLQAKHGRPEIEWTVDSFSISVSSKTLQETTTDAPGHIGLARAIESIPGAGIYVDLRGVIHVYDRTLGAERTVVQGLNDSLQGHGHLVWVDNSGLRPSSWRVYYDFELETRWEFRTPLAQLNNGGDSELESALGFTTLDNVVKVTDASLLIPEGSWGAARVVGEGTYITLAEAFAAWGTVSIGSKTLPQLTEEIVARHWLGDSLRRYAIGGAFTTSDPVWSARIAELMRCFRTVFRARPVTWERLRHAWTVRAAVWDPVTGTRADSPVYCNFHIQPLDHFMPTLCTFWGHDVTDRYPSTGLIADGKPSGFKVKLIDTEIGIFEIERDISRFPGHAKLVISDVERVARWDHDDPTLREPVLQALNPDWSLTFIISCSPAAPNDLRRLYSVPVTAVQAASTAGLAAAPDCLAPVKEERSQLGEARVAWTETGSVPTNIMLVVLGNGIEDDENESLTPVNLAQELQPLAKAIAAADLMALLDHYEGKKAVPMDRTIVPLGSIAKVTHKVTEDSSVTVIDCHGPRPIYRFEDYLSGSARSFLLKEIATRR